MASAKRTVKSCAPQGRYQCKSQCNNTFCKVTFDNGCVMEVTVGQHSEVKYGLNPASGRMENYVEWVNDDPCRTAAGY